MLINLYILIIIIPIVQIVHSENEQNLTATQNVTNHIKSKRHKGSNLSEYKFFDNVVEESAPVSVPIVQHTKRSKVDPGYSEIKSLLAKLLDKIREVEKEKRNGQSELGGVNSLANNNTVHDVVKVAEKSDKVRKIKKENIGKTPAKSRWGHWTDWSSCSVSCGKGREIRWRHCTEMCDDAETEMEEKTCQLPACGPGKLFGIKL